MPRTVSLSWKDIPYTVTTRWELQIRPHIGPPQDDQYTTIADDIEAIPEMSYTVGDLRPGSIYMFRVRAHDKQGAAS